MQKCAIYVHNKKSVRRIVQLATKHIRIILGLSKITYQIVNIAFSKEKKTEKRFISVKYRMVRIEKTITFLLGSYRSSRWIVRGMVRDNPFELSNLSSVLRTNMGMG